MPVVMTTEKAGFLLTGLEDPCYSFDSKTKEVERPGGVDTTESLHGRRPLEPDPDYAGVGKRRNFRKPSRKEPPRAALFAFRPLAVSAGANMQIKVNEQNYTFDDQLTAGEVRDRVKADADLLIINGFPGSAATCLKDGDQLVLIQRGEIPAVEDLEALLTARHTPGVHDAIRQSTVGIAGVGGLGSAIAIALVRTGIGHLIIADFDVVEPSNLNRQQYFIDQIGLPKVYALRDTLARINPHVRVTAAHLQLTPANIPEVFGHAQILVEAFDLAEQKVMLVETFAARFPDRPVVTGSGMAGYEPANSIRTQQVTRSLYLCGDGTTAAAPGTGLMAPRVGVAAHHQANAVLRLLLGCDPVSAKV